MRHKNVSNMYRRVNPSFRNIEEDEAIFKSHIRNRSSILIELN